MASPGGAALHRAGELTVQIDGSNRVRVHHEGRAFVFDHDALSILDVFHEGRSLVDGLQRLAPRLKGRRAMEDAIRSIGQMREAGILVDDAPSGFSRSTFPLGGYDASYVQIRMLNDRTRKSSFLQAIEEVVGPDDVVLDLGTGCGILAVAAARAGARHVYAVEPAGVIELARKVALDNGVADRISFLRGWSTQIELPERATVLTTDIIGNEALDMRLWETIDDARRRLLIPGARLIPASVATYAYLAAADRGTLDQYRPSPDAVRAWEASYEIDFGAMLTDSERVFSFYVEPHVAASWQPLSRPVPVYEVDLTSEPSSFESTQVVRVSDPGVANAYVSFLVARLGPSTEFSTRPASAGTENHWYCACWTLPRAVDVAPGDLLPFRYEYHGDGRSELTPLETVDSNTGNDG